MVGKGFPAQGMLFLPGVYGLGPPGIPLLASHDGKAGSLSNERSSGHYGDLGCKIIEKF